MKELEHEEVYDEIECENLVKEATIIAKNRKLQYHAFNNFYQLFKKAIKLSVNEFVITEYAQALLVCNVECSSKSEEERIYELKDALNVIANYEQKKSDNLSIEDLLAVYNSIEAQTEKYYEDQRNKRG